MPSGKSKPTGIPNSRSNAARTCSESELLSLAEEFVSGRPRIVLQGELGTGKSTLARAFLEALGVDRRAEGSPSFAIAHEYKTRDGVRVLHADGYRLRSEAELEATGLLEALWDNEVVILFEWLELFPETESALRTSDLPTIWIRLEFLEGDPSRRRIQIERTGG